MGDELETKPAHYRLSRATWEIIVDEYRRGATVPELSLKWRVSEHALRKRITVHGATKREWGDKIARDGAMAREAALVAQKEADKARVEALFCSAEGEASEGAEGLSLVAMRASARAMRAQMWDEAKVLAQLAEAYGRIAGRHERTAQRGEVRLEDIPYDLLKQIALDENQCASGRLAIWGEKDPHPAKGEYWKISAQREANIRDMVMAVRLQEQADRARIQALEQALAGVCTPNSKRDTDAD